MTAFATSPYGLASFSSSTSASTITIGRSVLTPYHGGPVSAAAHHLALSDAAILPDGRVRFTITLDGGTPAVPAHDHAGRGHERERKNTRDLGLAIAVGRSRLGDRQRLSL